MAAPLIVASVSYNDAKAFLVKHHYLRDRVPHVGHRFGVFDDGGALRGVALYHAPSRQTIAPSLLRDVQPREVLELSRLALADWPSRPPNVGSWLLAQCHRRLPEEVSVVVSYSDPTEGHYGGVYQAANAIYTGRAKARSYYYLDAAGTRLHPRRIWERARAAGLSEREFAGTLGLTEVRTSRQHRYLFLIGDARKKKATSARLLLQVLPYPKGVDPEDLVRREKKIDPAADWRTIALAVEWEGTVGVYRQRDRRSGLFIHKLVVSVGQAESRVELLDRIRRLAGGAGKVGPRDTDWVEDPTRPGREPMWQWQIGPAREAFQVAQKLSAHLITKAEQAQLVTRYPLGRRGRRVPAEEYAVREELYQRTVHLNHTGPRDANPMWMERAGRFVSEVTSPAERLRLLAMSIDFEGTVTINRGENDGHHGVSHAPLITIPQATQRRALLEVAMVLAGGLGQIVECSEDTRENRSDRLKWYIKGAGAITLAQLLVPHLISKKRQAELVGRFPAWDFTTALPDEIFAERERLYEEVHRLNLKGPR